MRIIYYFITLNLRNPRLFPVRFSSRSPTACHRLVKIRFNLFNDTIGILPISKIMRAYAVTVFDV